MKTAVKEIIDMCYTIIENSNDSKVLQTAKLIVFRCEDEFKELEKQQITDAFYDGKSNGMDISHPLSLTKEISAEQYYNETFNK